MKTEKNDVEARSFQLRTEDGEWLGQIVITSDGLFTGVTDYGSFAFAWRSTGNPKTLAGFADFICGLNVPYFGGKMYQGVTYVTHGKQVEKAAHIFSEKILPPLQAILREEFSIEPKLQP